ncbi:hypothetical protein BAC1_01405 [uncultured bacterium]|nr:hypothetical protein BAC1_01405 [uncultured bacterium]
MRKQTSSNTSQSKYPFLEAASKGVLIRVRLQPRSSRNQVEGVHNDSVKIRLTAPPVEGEANKALIEFLSEITGLRKSAFSISSGHKSRDKAVLAEGASLASFEKAFSEVIP